MEQVALVDRHLLGSEGPAGLFPPELVEGLHVRPLEGGEPHLLHGDLVAKPADLDLDLLFPAFLEVQDLVNGSESVHRRSR